MELSHAAPPAILDQRAAAARPRRGVGAFPADGDRGAGSGAEERRR